MGDAPRLEDAAPAGRVDVSDVLAHGVAIDRMIEAAAQQEPLDAAELEARVQADRAARRGTPRKESDVRRPEVQVNARDTIVVLEEAWDAVRAYNKPPSVFQRAGAIVRIRPTETGPLLYDCGPNDVQALLITAARWRKVYVTKDGEERSTPVDPPRTLAPAMVALPATDLPVIESIIRVPVFDAKGRLISKPGYDAGSHLYYDPPAGFRTPAVSAAPSRAEVKGAVDFLLRDWLGDFPFVKASDRAHALALMLNPLVRRMYRGASPLHMIEATSMGTGKTLLGTVLLIPSQGAVPELLTLSEDDAETRKLVTTVLTQGQGVIFFDNVDSKLKSPVLAGALTSESWSDRILGRTGSVTVPNRATWLVTINNATVNTDIARRSIRCRLDRAMERPWAWQGMKIKNLRDWSLDHRDELLRAALTIVQAWIADGMREDETAHLGSFEGWSRLMGGILRTAEVPGFLCDLDELYQQADTGLSEWRAFIGEWRKRFGLSPVFPKQLAELAASENMLGDTLGAGTERSQHIRMGFAVHKYRGRIFDGYRIAVHDTAKGKQYALELRPTEEAPLPPPPPAEPLTYPDRGEDEPPPRDDDAQPWGRGR